MCTTSSAWRVIELIRGHRLHEAHIVDHPGEMRQPIRDPRATRAVLPERKLRSQELRRALNEGESLPGEKFLRTVFPVMPGQLRLVVEKFQLARRPGHVEKNHAFGPGRLPGSQRIERIDRRVDNPGTLRE